MKEPTKIIPWLAWYTPFQPYAFALLRIVIGLIIAFHGFSRLFLGHGAPELAVLAAGLTPKMLGGFELLTGCLFAAGLLVRPVAALLAIEWLAIVIAAPLPAGKSWLMLGARDHYPAMMVAVSVAYLLGGSSPLTLGRFFKRDARAQDSAQMWPGHPIIRVTLGLMFLSPGIDKVFFDGWHRIASGNIKVLGLYPPEAWALGVAGFELGAALLILSGLFVRPTAFAIIVQLSVILFGIFGSRVWGGIFFWSESGFEDITMIVCLAFTLVLAGAGRYSLDHLRGREF